ncbi:hypothetical protein CEXT_196161 [Caerostris extrusa]|uniref:Uncharacterized protein n=1 Tax=Caerostris extrusa TaxID=172846 RepID=A0AAV4QQ54_CAEEX|nr:hypothetical protein CEXT_196161 [Caerostris extrusa]
MMKFLCFLMVLTAVGAQFPESFTAFLTPVVEDKTAVKAPDFLSLLQSKSEKDESHYETGDETETYNIEEEPTHQPQCQVDVRIVQRRPGKCVLLAGNTLPARPRSSSTLSIPTVRKCCRYLPSSSACILISIM